MNFFYDKLEKANVVFQKTMRISFAGLYFQKVFFTEFFNTGFRQDDEDVYTAATGNNFKKTEFFNAFF